MSQFLETILIRNRQAYNLEWHQRRVDKVSRDFFGSNTLFRIAEELSIPDDLEEEDYKCRLIYTDHIEKLEFTPYQKKAIRSLRIIEPSQIDYAYKFTDRSALSSLYDQRAGADDILIVKNGMVTDSYYANVVFFDGNQLITPANPLLPGTKRAKLLAEGRIKTGVITRKDIWKFQEIHLINAMIDPGEIVINTEQVTF